MPWFVGIDEAGYGPNLGPLVMTSVSCHIPDELGETNLWRVLRGVIRHVSEPADERPLVADSKLVYSSGRGIRDLESSVLSAVVPDFTRSPASLEQYIDRVCPDSHPALREESWYSGATMLPVEAELPRCRSAADQIAGAMEQLHLRWGPVRSVVVCPPRFNDLLDRWGSKAAVLGHGLSELLNRNLDLDPATDAAHFFIDKHGGRNHYAPMLQDALPDGMVSAVVESRDRSVYRVLGLSRDIRLTFQPRADGEHFCVALASMVSKYLREMLMREFNEFWEKHVPGLKPTAGYPGDATRFLRGIRPALQRLGIDEAAIWRKK